MATEDPRPSPLDAPFFAEGGEMGRRVAAFDWVTTPLGDPRGWSKSLLTAVGIVLRSRFPMMLWWGPELTIIYNDAYFTVAGDKHPSILGRRGEAAWGEIWGIIGPRLHRVLELGEASWSDDELLLVHRYGYEEEAYFTFSYSPVLDDTGAIGGVFCAVTETTNRVIGERRLRTLRDVGTATGAFSVEVASTRAAEAMGRNPADLPFVLLYLLDGCGHIATLAGSAGVDAGSPLALRTVAVESGGDPWALGEVVRIGMPIEARDLDWGDGICRRAADQPLSARALVVPIPQAGKEVIAGVLVAGISSRLALDDAYRGFVELLAGQVGSALADARALEAERERAERLAELDRAKTAFLANVSHEFRTPLTLLMGPAEDIVSDPQARPQNRERARMVRRAGARLQTLVDRLLQFSRLDAGRQHATFEPTALAEFTADVASQFRAEVERTGMLLIVDCPPLAQPVWVDRELWEHIVLNLLSNAYKFTLEGEIGVTLRPAGDRVEVRVSDTGVGIPEREIPRIFERFHRVPSSDARSIEGTGIGLSLVREMTELHGGEVRVESRVAGGSTFIVSLPLGHEHLPPDQVRVTDSGAPAKTRVLGSGLSDVILGAPAEDAAPVRPDALAQAETNGPLSTAGAHLVVVDDNADMRRYLVDVLGGRWSVEAVADGRAALEAMRRQPPDLLLTDVMMPGLDGFELLRAVREDARLRATPVVMLSARAGSEAAIEGLDAGADDYLVKPFSRAELVARIRTTIQLSRMREQLAQSELRYASAERALELALRTVVTVHEQLETSDGLSSFLGRLSAAIADLLSADKVCFYHCQPDGTLAADPGAFGVAPEVVARLTGIPCAPGDGTLASRVVFDGEQVRLSSLAAPEFDAARLFIDLLGATDGIAAPWRTGSRVLGCIGVCNARGREFSNEDGWVLRIAAVAAGMVWQNREMHELIGSLRDREAEELRAEAERATRLETLKSEFLRLASHELRGPLAVARGYLSMLEEGSIGELPAAARDVLPVVRSRLDQMNALVDHMLEVARLEEERLELTWSDADLRDLVRRAVAVVKPTATPAHRLVAEVGPDPIPVRVDIGRVETILVNVIGNAVKYSPAGGVVRCMVASVGRTAGVRVSDQGPGISAEDLPRLFQRFGRIVTPENRHISGTGLGLYLARTLARMHGGDLTAESEVGHGSAFLLTLPVSAAAEQVASTATTTSPLPLTVRKEATE